MTASYNVWLVLLSYLVAAFAAYTTLGLAARVNRPDGGLARGWMAAGAVAMGIGIWAMHFIGMLALHLPVHLSYDVAVTLVSIVPAIGASAVALLLMRRARVGLALHLGCALAMGLGIAAMHYTGMASVRMQPDYSYDPVWVAVSVLVGVAASFAALSISLRARDESDASAPLRSRGAAALVMGLAIVAMHYSGMRATHFVEGSVCISPPLGVDPIWLALMVGVGSCLLLLAMLAAATLDLRRLERKRQVDADMLVRATELAEEMNADAISSEAHKRAIVESSLDGIITIDRLGRVIEFNAAAEVIFGYRRDQVLGWPLSECIIPPALRERHERGFARVLAGGPSMLLGRRIEIGAMRRNGEEFPIELALTSTPIGGEPAFTAHLRDLTERRAAEQSLRLRGLALDSVDNGICIVDGRGAIEYMNPAFEAICGWPAEALLGVSYGRLFRLPDGREAVPRALRVSVARGGLPLTRLHHLRPDGRELWCDVVVKVLRGESGQVTHSVAVVSDVTEAVLHEQQLNRLANFDSLTGLANRAHFRRLLDQRLGRDRPMSLLFVDMDGFKQINDTFGHHVGDELLSVLGQRLKACMRDGDLVARLGGDEFVMLIEARGTTLDVMEHAVIDRVRASLAQPIHARDELLMARCSIGISRFPEDGTDADTLLRVADHAMYTAKRSGRTNEDEQVTVW